MMKRKMILIMSCLMIIAVVCLSACGKEGKDESSTTGVKEADKYKIGISMPSESLERWNKDVSYLKEKFEKDGYEIEVTYAGNNVDRQNDDIRKMISDGADILVVASIDGEMLTDSLSEAKSKNIPVIAYDRLIMNTDAVSYYVSFDNYEVGKLQAEYIVNALKLNDPGDKTYNMEIFAGDSNDNNAKFFYNGSMDVLNKYINSGKIKVVSGQTEFETVATAQWSTNEAMERMKNILISYYSDGTKINACLCANDAVALGITRAIQSYYKNNNVPVITGQDADSVNVSNIIHDKQSMTVYKEFSNEAVVTYELVKSLLEDNATPESICDKLECKCSYDISTYDNGTGVIPSFLLEPEVITKDNYKEKLIDTGYYKIGDNGYIEPAQ